MKKIGIITLNGNHNYGNKLQNYALIKFINDNFANCICTTLWEEDFKRSFLKRMIKNCINYKKYIRSKNIKKFNKFLNIKKLDYKDTYDHYIIGSDQVWNMRDNNYSFRKYFALFSPKEKNIAYAASIGVDYIESSIREEFINCLNNIQYISVREKKAQEIIDNIYDKKNIEVLIDPTLLLNQDDWNSMVKMPTKIPKKKYILNYFLGDLDKKTYDMINSFAIENDCEIINITNPRDKYYYSNPCEFLWLEKNAFIILTDSFHSCVFSIIFDRPFVAFKRVQEGVSNMFSRIETLVDTLSIENRFYNGINITSENMQHNYESAYKIIKKERKKSIQFLKTALGEKNEN